MANGNIHTRINTKGTVEAWARFTIKDWQKEIDRRGIGRTGNLRNSFKYQLFFSGDEPSRIVFSFLNYGRFADMGVGKGVTIDEVSELKTSRRLEGRNSVNPRRPMKWFNKPFHYNHNRLAEILGDLYGRRITTQIVEIIQT